MREIRNKKIKKKNKKDEKSMKCHNNSFALGCMGLIILLVIALQFIMTFVSGKLG
jgi:hypothetical protein